MAVDTYLSGSTITNSGIIAQHQSVRTIINGQSRDTLDRSALGDQHLQQGVLITADVNESTTAESLTFAGFPIAAETTADISANWKRLTSYDLDNAGAGYSLPPCKVLIWFNGRLKELDTTANDNGQAWLCLYYSVNSTPVYKMVNVGMIHAPEAAFTAIVNYNLAEEPVCIVDVIDQTNAGSTWTLDWVRVKAAVGRGSGAAPAPGNVEFLQGITGMMAFYKDE